MLQHGFLVVWFMQLLQFPSVDLNASTDAVCFQFCPYATRWLWNSIENSCPKPKKKKKKIWGMISIRFNLGYVNRACVFHLEPKAGISSSWTGPPLSAVMWTAAPTLGSPRRAVMRASGVRLVLLKPLVLIGSHALSHTNTYPHCRMIWARLPQEEARVGVCFMLRVQWLMSKTLSRS